jgi:hypothetical protein
VSDEPENTAENGRDEKGRFGPGNPGKPKGSRHALGEAFIKALHDDFMKHGDLTIETVRLEKPDQYVKVIASLLPKEFKIETTSDLTDEQLDARIRQLANLIEVGVAGASGGSEAAEGSATAH